jgi:hypothetical protein
MMARQNVSSPVFMGMIAASTFGIILVPMLYVMFQTIRERVKRLFTRQTDESSNLGHHG